MPRHTSAAVAYCLAALSVCLVAGGCAPPVVKVSHTLPAALPVPAGAGRLRVGEITVAGPATQPGDGATSQTNTSIDSPAAVAVVPVTTELAEFMKASLGEALETKGWIHPRLGDTRPSEGSGECIIDATIHAAIGEARGKRTVGLLDPATKATRPLEVPTLVRRAKVRVEFALSRAGQGLGIAEVVRTYDSALDPAVRGKLGLERPDDPNRVPPAEPIVDGLLAQCAEAFKSLTTPTPLKAEVQLRPAAGAAADKAFQAVGKADWNQAVTNFMEAAVAAPNDPALSFNLAAAAEAAGHLDAAIGYYQRAYDLSGEKDAEAYEGVRRCRRVLEARKLPALPAAGKGL